MTLVGLIALSVEIITKRSTLNSTAKSQSFAVPGDRSIEVLSFDGMTSGDAGSANEAIAQSGAGMMWLPVVGLDRHTPMIGLRTLQSGDDPSMTGATDSAVVQRARYRPICEFQTATQT